MELQLVRLVNVIIGLKADISYIRDMENRRVCILEARVDDLISEMREVKERQGFIQALAIVVSVACLVLFWWGLR